MTTYENVLIDDMRSFRDGREAIVLRNSADALSFLGALVPGDHITSLFLDHDLGSGDDIRPVIYLLEESASNHTPVDVGAVYIVTGNPVGSRMMMSSLTRWGYNVVPAMDHPDLCFDYEALEAEGLAPWS